MYNRIGLRVRLTVTLLFVMGMVSYPGVPYAISQEPFDPSDYPQIIPDNLSHLTEVYQIDFFDERVNITDNLAFSADMQWLAFTSGATLNLIQIQGWTYRLQTESCAGPNTFDYYSQFLIIACSYEIHLWQLEDLRHSSFETGSPPEEVLTSPSDVQVLGAREEVVTTYGSRGGIKRWTFDGELIEEIDFDYGPEAPIALSSTLSPNGNLNVYVLAGTSSTGEDRLQMQQVSPFSVIADLSFENTVEADNYSIGPIAIDITDTVVVNIQTGIEEGIIIYLSSDGKLGTYFEHSLFYVSSIEYSAPDVLVIGTRAGDIYVMQALLSTPTLYHLDGHTARITDLSFTSGRRALVSTSEDGTVRFWGVVP